MPSCLYTAESSLQNSLHIHTMYFLKCYNFMHKPQVQTVLAPFPKITLPSQLQKSECNFTKGITVSTHFHLTMLCVERKPWSFSRTMSHPLPHTKFYSCMNIILLDYMFQHKEHHHDAQIHQRFTVLLKCKPSSQYWYTTSSTHHFICYTRTCVR
jgi:hypothetical protein